MMTDFYMPALQTLASWIFLIFGVTLPFILVLKVIGITGFQQITRFEKHSSFYYRLNPVTKIVFTFLVTFVAATTVWWIGGIITVGLLGIYLTLLDGRRKFALGLFLISATIVGTVQGLAPYTPNEIVAQAMGKFTPIVIWTWPSYFAIVGFVHVLTLQALTYSLQVSTRITPVLLSSLLLVMTSTPSEILRSLRKAGLPIAFIFSLIVAMRTIPRVFDAIDLSIKSQFMRGLGSNARSFIRPFYYLEAGFASIIPILVFMLRGAKNTAISADTRAFRAYNTRTYLFPSRFSRDDLVMVVVIVAMLASAVVAIYLGFGRSVPYAGF
jgi:energy-coupling factor transport system permease protein